jgi:signal peptidase I
LIALALTIAAKLFVIDIVRVAQDSMEPVLHDGQIALVYVLNYGLRNPFGQGYFIRWAEPRRGDLVVIRRPGTGARAVKRVIGVPGDSIALEPGEIVVAGRSLPIEGFLAARFLGRNVVPDDSFFVAGDNVPESVDSREYGFVESDSIEGQLVLWLF